MIFVRILCSDDLLHVGVFKLRSFSFQVCHALGTVVADSTAWQLRARRLIGSKAGFPVGPREGFDWPTACMEIEQLKTCWTSEVHHGARQTQEDEEERNQMRLQQRVRQDGMPVVKGA